ncbi:hypothetical protein P692DRAFT_201789130 [Suillus brevipes Sb2]|nr:hypothetical protein P692DRAFT_201789130 [Suillus brevipes Sb2]
MQVNDLVVLALTFTGAAISLRGSGQIGLHEQSLARRWFVMTSGQGVLCFRTPMLTTKYYSQVDNGSGLL